MAGSDSTDSRTLAPGLFTAVRRRGGAAVAAIPLALAIVVGLGVVLRAGLWFAYDPAIMNVADTTPYVSMAINTLFADFIRTAGYSMFLRGVHELSADLDFTLAIQHLLGIATGLITYATVRRVGGPVWAGTVGAAAVLLSLDQILVEHTLLSEVLFGFVLVSALYAGVRAIDEPRTLRGRLTSRHLWLIAAGALLGLSAWTRAVSAPLIPLLGIFFVLAVPGPIWARLGRGALAAGTALAVLLVYFTMNSETTGTFGLASATGWATYARAAPFADCTQFSPPAEYADELCEGIPKDERPGPDFYAWQKRSPAQKLFGYPPTGDDTLAEFGRSAILAQPRDYAITVGRDTLRYFFPEINNEQYLGGSDYEYLDIHRRDRALEREIQAVLGAYYTPEALSVNEGALDALTELQQVLRVQPLLMLQAIILGALGAWFARGRVRAGILLLIGTSVLLLLIPSAVGTYNARYTIPIGGPLIAAGALGLWACIERLRGRQADAGAVEPHPAESI